jgi:hypothetical protein
MPRPQRLGSRKGTMNQEKLLSLIEDVRTIISKDLLTLEGNSEGERAVAVLAIDTLEAMVRENI